MDGFLWGNHGLASCRLEPLSGGRKNRLWRCGPWVVKLYDHGRGPELVEMLSFRLGAARWLERAGEEMGDWLADG